MTMAITNVHLVNVRDGSVTQDAVIVIHGDRIASVTERTKWHPQGEMEIMDGHGFFALPGLIDMHVHMCFDPSTGLDAESRRRPSAVYLGIVAARNLGTSLRAGVTTVRDLGAPFDASFDVKRAWRASIFQGSRPLVAGPMITALGGHGTEVAIPIGLEVCGEDDIQRAVRRVVARGADVVKVATCGTVVQTELTLPELRAAVEEAHWCGRRVASHAHFKLRSVRNSVLAGCDTIEHGCVVDDEIIEAMVNKRTYVCPTITVFARVIQFPDEFGGVGSRFVDTVQRMFEIQQSNFAKMCDRGVPIIAGTDAGMPCVEFSALLDELEFMVEWGMSPHDALRATTSNAAEALDRTDLGTIEPGAIADLILVDTNPLVDIRALRQIRAVMQAGKVVS